MLEFIYKRDRESKNKLCDNIQEYLKRDVYYFSQHN